MWEGCLITTVPIYSQGGAGPRPFWKSLGWRNIWDNSGQVHTSGSGQPDWIRLGSIAAVPYLSRYRKRAANDGSYDGYRMYTYRTALILLA